MPRRIFICPPISYHFYPVENVKQLLASLEAKADKELSSLSLRAEPTPSSLGSSFTAASSSTHAPPLSPSASYSSHSSSPAAPALSLAPSSLSPSSSTLSPSSSRAVTSPISSPPQSPRPTEADRPQGEGAVWLCFISRFLLCYLFLCAFTFSPSSFSLPLSSLSLHSCRQNPCPG